MGVGGVGAEEGEEEIEILYTMHVFCIVFVCFKNNHIQCIPV